MRHTGFVILPLIFIALTACSQTAKREDPGTGTFVSGNARVVSVDQLLGQAVLDFNGSRLQAFWQTEAWLAQGGSMVRQNPIKPMEGAYQEPVLQAQKLEALPGDVIYFSGMWTGRNEVLLRSVNVVQR